MPCIHLQWHQRGGNGQRDHRDKNCIKTYDEERRASAASDFDGEDAEDDDWMQRLTRSKNLEIEKTINNLVLIYETKTQDEVLWGKTSQGWIPMDSVKELS